MTTQQQTMHQTISQLLLALEQHLVTLNLWSSTRPSAEALASTEPFAVDTLSFAQWLQFIFIPKMQQLATTLQPLPSNCAIAPMGEEYLKIERLTGDEAKKFLATLQQIDQCLEQQ